MKRSETLRKPQGDGLAALDSYAKILELLTKDGDLGGPRPTADLLFVRNVQGLGSLFQTMSAVGAAKSGAGDEEWNPLSQRPHSPLVPTVPLALGAEIATLKAAVDVFTTLAHEMMHVALWEPFFTGRWRPRRRASFHEFSLLAEGFCFFFSDIIVTGEVRVRLPDGEFAMDRQASINAHFHPVQAFNALGIKNHDEVLDIYLEGFRGGQTRLWQPRGTSSFVAALAAQVYEFYADSLQPLEDLHVALGAFGGLSEFYRRFCAIPGLPTFLREADAPLIPEGGGADLKDFFTAFYRHGLTGLQALAPGDVEAIRWRRMLQMRAYYALQVRWLVSKKLVVARGLSAPLTKKLLTHLDAYLKGLESLLKSLAKQHNASPLDALRALDAAYEAQVRSEFTARAAWVGQRWMILPRRAGGHISVFAPAPARDRDAKIRLLQIVACLVDELTRRVRDSTTVEERSELLASMQKVAALGASGGNGNAAATRLSWRRLQRELGSPRLLDLWSVPMASFDPVHNEYRELVFSYQ